MVTEKQGSFGPPYKYTLHLIPHRIFTNCLSALTVTVHMLCFLFFFLFTAEDPSAFHGNRNSSSSSPWRSVGRQCGRVGGGPSHL